MLEAPPNQRLEAVGLPFGGRALRRANKGVPFICRWVTNLGVLRAP